MKRNTEKPLLTRSQMLVSLAILPEDDLRLYELTTLLTGQKVNPAPSLRLYRIGEASIKTGLSRTTLWRAIREGRLRTTEIRKNSHRIAESELLRFCEGREL